MLEFLDWIARAGGAVALLVGVVGFLFREKWKQMLQRSLAEDLERLKSELTKSQADHAASLTPQLEQIKHDFQQKLEAYKVSLIAQAEGVRARGELKKTIALRFADIEFERLVALEHVVSPLVSDIVAVAMLGVEQKTAEQTSGAIQRLQEMSVATDRAEMFMSSENRTELIAFRMQLLEVVRKHIGRGRPMFDMNEQERAALLTVAARVHMKLMERIRALGSL